MGWLFLPGSPLETRFGTSTLPWYFYLKTLTGQRIWVFLWSSLQCLPTCMGKRVNGRHIQCTNNFLKIMFLKGFLIQRKLIQPLQSQEREFNIWIYLYTDIKTTKLKSQMWGISWAKGSTSSLLWLLSVFVILSPKWNRKNSLIAILIYIHVALSSPSCCQLENTTNLWVARVLGMKICFSKLLPLTFKSVLM